MKQFGRVIHIFLGVLKKTQKLEDSIHITCQHYGEAFHRLIRYEILDFISRFPDVIKNHAPHMSVLKSSRSSIYSFT